MVNLLKSSTLYRTQNRHFLPKMPVLFEYEDDIIYRIFRLTFYQYHEI